MPPGQSILITGATSGIGRDAALRLARAGHLVLAGGRRPDALAALAREARGRARGRLEPVTLDVTDPASVGAARALAERRTGGRGLDVLVTTPATPFRARWRHWPSATCVSCSTPTCSGSWR